MVATFSSTSYINFFVVLTTAYGCGQFPTGQGRTLSFTITGFKLPAAMAYSEDNGATSIVPNISTSSQRAITFVQSLIMRSTEEVLYQQGRSAFLSDDTISLILEQLSVNVSYTPLKCDTVKTNPASNTGKMKMDNCLIVGGTVTSVCNPPQDDMCELPAMAQHHKPVDSQHLTISGSFTTSNVIMANWSNQMWQGVVNRVLRSLASGALGSNFYGASVTIQ